MRIWIIGIVIALILIVGFVLSAPKVGGPAIKTGATSASSTPLVFVHDAYRKGTHTLQVSVAGPNPCASVTGQSSVIPATSSSSPPVIAIAVDIQFYNGICLQEPATTTLSFTASANASATIEASVNGSSTPVVSD